MKKLALLLALACVALGALAGGGSASPAVGAAPVMTGLHNPRGLAFDNHGSLYVAEAGQGGSAPCAVFSDGMTKCYGPTGRISRLKNGVQAVVADGLPSNAPAGGNGATGPHNIAVEGGHLFVTDGLGGNPLDPAMQPFRALGQGTLIKVHPDSHWSVDDRRLGVRGGTQPGRRPGQQSIRAVRHRRPSRRHGCRRERPARSPRQPRRAARDVPVTSAAQHGCRSDDGRAGARRQLLRRRALRRSVQRRRCERLPRRARSGDGLLLRLHGDHLDRVRAGRPPVRAPVRERTRAERAGSALSDRLGLREDARRHRSLHPGWCRVRP